MRSSTTSTWLKFVAGQGYNAPDMAFLSRIADGPRLWLLFAAFHTAVSALMAWIGSTDVLSSLHNAEGIWYFAQDSKVYLDGLERLRNVLLNQGFTAWLNYSAPFNEKLFSFAYSLSGGSRLAIIPLNTAFYLFTLWLVFRLGTVLFERRVGMLAVLCVACLPSYLLQSTQLLKDSVLLPGQLLFLYGLVLILRSDDNRRMAWAGIAWATVGYLCVLLIQNNMIPLMLLIGGISFLIACALWIGNRSRLVPVVATFSLLIVLSGMNIAFRFEHRYFAPGLNAAVGVPRDGEATLESEMADSEPGRLEDMVQHHPRLAISPDEAVDAPRSRASAILQKLKMRADVYIAVLANMRDGFRNYYRSSHSNIDTHIALQTFSDMLCYSPRALQIGFLAPFPTTWFEQGKQTGRIGRLVAGAEMMMVYLALVFALLSLWKERQHIILLLPVSFVVTGLWVHALVITNLGCLYRQRYVYWFVLFIFAVHGALYWRSVRNASH